jgi:signal transduction histidine kinase
MLAHELRNPLAPISNAMHIIRSASGNPELVAASSAVVQRQLGHMVRLVNDLMDISRISRGKIELRLERVSLANIVAHALETCRPEIAMAKQSLSHAAPDPTLMVRGDAVRLSQVICNLLHNASKYSAGGGHIELRVRAADDDVEIVVRDDGIGIPPERLADIFVMFTQLDGSLEKARSGLGVGLSLVKTLVELHGGQVHAASPGIGRGSTFTVKLPLDRD